MLLPPWLCQAGACLLVFLLSARLPAQSMALLSAGLAAASGSARSDQGAAMAALQLSLDAFALLCALYLSHQRLRGIRIWRCYPPRRLIPLSLHLLGLLWGLIRLAPAAPAGSSSVLLGP